MSYKLIAIRTMLQLGFKVFPLTPRSKKPVIKDWRNRATASPEKALKYFKTHSEQNYGVLLGEDVFLVDVDGAMGKASLTELVRANTKMPETLIVSTPGGGWHFYYRAPPGLAVRNSAGRLGEGIDIRGDGGYGVGPGSVHPNGGIYRIRSDKGGREANIALAPGWLLTKIRDTRRAHTEPQLATPARISPSQRPRAEAYAKSAFDRECERLRKAPNHQRNNTLNLCAFQLGQLVIHGLLDERVVARDLSRVAKEIGLTHAEIGPTIASGLQAGRKYPRNFDFLETKVDRRNEAPRRKQSDLMADLAKLGNTDTDNATRFAARNGRRVAYSRGHGWLIYDGKRFVPDSGLACMELAKKTARLIAGETRHIDKESDRIARAKFAEQSLSKASLDRMLALAESLVVVDDKSLDADPWLFNTLTGTIDLRSGILHPHEPRDLLTKLAPVNADMQAKCPGFKAFLKRIMRGDTAKLAYLQRALGYTLTGDTREQVFFFCQGEGRNGKSTLVNLIREILGDYGVHTPTETLLLRHFDNNIPADLARLHGARMVTAIESNYNRPLDEAKIKAMTGGEPITARFMRQNYFEFVPQFKLWFVANDFPRVRLTASAFWRRPHVIAFLVQIPESEVDPKLSKVLKAESAGILAWMVRGCLKWQQKGLAPPPAIVHAARTWQEGLELVGRFLDERVVFEEAQFVTSSGMYSVFQNWCRSQGEQPISTPKFKARLQELGIVYKRLPGKGTRIWQGVKLRH